MADTTFIYGLIDPRIQELRYVGKANSLRQRLKLHMYQCRRSSSRRDLWLRELKILDAKPEIFEIEAVPSGEWQDAERFWISYFKFIGAALLNGTSGGDSGCSHMPDVKDKMSKSHKGKKFSNEHKMNISLSRIGIDVLGPEARQAQRSKLIGRDTWMKGKSHSIETRARMSESAKKRVANGWINPMSSSSSREKLMGDNNPARQAGVGSKISNANKDRVVKLETREKIRQKLKGRKPSPNALVGFRKWMKEK